MGHKIDAIEKHDKVSFCVIDQDKIIQEEYTSYFRSVIVFGKAHIVENTAEKREVLFALVNKYSPDQTIVHKEQAIEKDFQFTSIIVIDIEYVSGKEAIELVNQKG